MVGSIRINNKLSAVLQIGAVEQFLQNIFTCIVSVVQIQNKSIAAQQMKPDGPRRTWYN